MNDAFTQKQLLREVNFLSALPAACIDRLSEVTHVRQIPRGSTLFREGDSDPNLYFVRSGQIALEMKVPGRGSVRIMTLGAGDMLGWSALLTKSRMTATAIALTETEVLVASAEALKKMAEGDREFGYHLMTAVVEALTRRLIATRLQFLDLFKDSPNYDESFER